MRTVIIILFVIIFIQFVLWVGVNIKFEETETNEYKIVDSWIVETVKYNKNWQKQERKLRFYIELENGMIFEVTSADYYFFAKKGKMIYTQVRTKNLWQKIGGGE